MNEIERITDQFRRAFERDAWHGLSVREALEGVTAGMAARKTLSNTHPIWEIVLHIAAWETFVRKHLEGDTLKGLPETVDWPSVNDTSEAAWRRAVDELVQDHLPLRQAVSRFPETRLDETVPGKSFTFYVLVHGAVQMTFITLVKSHY